MYTVESEEVRKSGIPAVGNIRWGAHLCQFYKSRDDLADMLVNYFQVGLEGNEQCLWVTADPLRADDARTMLRAVVSGFDAFEARGQIEIIDWEGWYMRTGSLDPEKLIWMWIEKQEIALQRGYAGLRASGNTFWLEQNAWQSFAEYETRLTRAFQGRRLIGLCSYCLGHCNPEQILDVVRSHQFALVRRDHSWDLIESSSLKVAKEELRRLNEELDLRVRERTAELEAALRVREEFLSVASHELKTPLTSLQLYVDGLLRSGRKMAHNPEEIAGRLMKAKEESVRLERLVNDLLDISRTASGKLPLSYAEVDLVELSQAVTERFTDSIRRAGCSLSLRAGAPVTGVWDRLRLEQVLVNLVSNAIKYAPGARIEVTVSEQGEQAALSVKDEGPGIAPDDQRRIFERFVQISPEQYRTGFGLGLWIVRQIVNALGGTIHLSSAPGEGSTFTVLLPRTPAGASQLV